MSAETVRSIGILAADTAVEAAWAQWGALTAAAVPVGRLRIWTIIDPEALLLLSLAVRDRERRLNDLLAGWARAGSSLLSVQRLRTLAKEFPPPVREQVGDFARHAADAGDRRWRKHAAGPDEDGSPEPRRKDTGPLRLVEGPTLMLRLRAGFGVGAKADLLAFLLGLGGAAAELKAITVATGYSGRAMRTAAEEMALARFIHEIQGPPSAYRADPAAWERVLETHQLDPRPESHPGIPPWRFWSVAFAFLADVVRWAEEAEGEEWSGYYASSRARDLMEVHRRRLRYLQLHLAAGDWARGAAYLDPFRDIVERVSTWVRESLYE
ncbi:MAG TPA: hypothetical protein VGR37_17630 [Longimicrobiaceae bacterium]|nr:hypothetical protein [Longimicrobiaceae bacterium]